MHKFSRGFSLLEVLVAFVILALILSVLMQIFSGGLRNASRADEYQQAVLLGQSKLASVGIETPLEVSESNGEFDAVYRWHVSIRPYLETPAQASDADWIASADFTRVTAGSGNPGAMGWQRPATLGQP